MDWRKVDAPLASALAGAPADEPLSVFVHIDPARADIDRTELDRLGLGHDPAGVSTAALSPSHVDALTDVDWVLSLRLSGRLRLLWEPAAPSAPAGDEQAGAGDERHRPKQDKGKARPS
ncbi:MAG: hypothetical protein ACR2HM_09575 [Acidimicrobiales bacterium]